VYYRGVVCAGSMKFAQKPRAGLRGLFTLAILVEVVRVLSFLFGAESDLEIDPVSPVPLADRPDADRRAYFAAHAG